VLNILFQNITFQAILATDHTSATYSIVNYKDNNIRYRTWRGPSIGYKCDDTKKKTLWKFSFRQSGYQMQSNKQRNTGRIS